MTDEMLSIRKQFEKQTAQSAASLASLQTMVSLSKGMNMRMGW
jgi:hypothetical protein